jgi:uncharacterized phage infection (PIP) family protein YhgE
MRKTLIIGMVIALLAVGATAVYAQGGPGGGRGSFGGGAGLNNQLDAVAEALGLEADELQTALADGQTIAEVADAQGVALDDVIAALTADRADALAEQVADGSLSQEQADAMLALLEANLNQMLNNDTLGARFGGGDKLNFGFGGGELADVIGALDIDLEDLQTAMQEGQTLAEFAAAQDIDLDAVRGDLVTAYQTRLDEAVEAGDITAESADARMTLMAEHLDALLSGDLSSLGRGFFSGRDSGRMFQGRDQMNRGGNSPRGGGMFGGMFGGGSQTQTAPGGQQG